MYKTRTKCNYGSGAAPLCTLLTHFFLSVMKDSCRHVCI